MTFARLDFLLIGDPLSSSTVPQPCTVKSAPVRHNYCVTVNLFRSAARPFPSIYLCRMQNWTERQETACQAYAVNVIAIARWKIAVHGFRDGIHGKPGSHGRDLRIDDDRTVRGTSRKIRTSRPLIDRALDELPVC